LADNQPRKRLGERETRSAGREGEGIMSEWYVRLADKIFGPMPLEDLQRRVAAGQIPPESPVREGPNGPWAPASRAIGGAAARSDGAAPVFLATRERETAARRTLLALRPCSDCGELVSQQASACPRCGRALTLTTIDVPYRGEHPIAMLVFFSVLAGVFAVVTPMIVYHVADSLAASADLMEAIRGRVALFSAIAYTVSMIVCAVLGRAVGTGRMAFFTGTMLGLFFGPMGVLVAFAVDKRTQCPNCYSRLGGLARECPYCRVRLRWEQRRPWY
jgi:hypothetical protein